jgi:TolB-like protein/Tfp pilus assembly protein PilF
MNPRNFLAELQRRNVYRVGVAYAVIAWLLIQIATQVFPFFEIPNWAVRLVVLLLVLGFLVALVLAWAFELTAEGVKRTEEIASEGPTTHGRNRKLDFLIVGVLLAIIAILIYQRVHPPVPSSTTEKSIAVLPFENLSANPENAFFADGVQDEILTNLARIADLKVISRSSVMQYKSNEKRNAREIAKALGVAHLLEGSVQRAGGELRINAQLIDARNDAHLWAQTYDRDVTDLFAVQSEIAKTIADQLRAKLSPGEKAEIERFPTGDVETFDLYTRANTLLVTAALGQGKAQYLEAVELLNQAVGRDPKFFVAFCQLVHSHAELYFYNFDHTPARLELVESALQTAARLRPDAGETHLARAEYLYRCVMDFDRARAELAMAAQSLPNSSRVFSLIGFIDRRQGRWENAIRNLEKALQFDPRNLTILQQAAATYPFLRRFQDEAVALDRVLALDPHDLGVRISRAFVELEMHANLQPYRDAINAILAESPEIVEEVSSEWFAASWYERNAAEAARAAAAIPAEGAGSNAVRFPRAWYEGLAARLRGDTAAARDAFSRARVSVEHDVRVQPDYGPTLCVLGLIDAALERKEVAIQEGRHAVELLPTTKDSINGSHLVMYLAIIYAWTGEKDLAIEQLNALLSHPGDGSYGDLRFNPFWDPLRGDPRFEKIIASLAPKG